MKKLIYIIILYFCYSCGSVDKEKLILKHNLELVKKQYPNSTIETSKYYSYVFKLQKDNIIFYVIVKSDGTIVKTNKL